MKVLAIGSYKGGTGKTTTAVNLAYNLSARGKKVLLIDTDPQANATYMFAKVNDNNYTLADLFSGAKITRCIYRTKHEWLDIIKSTSRMEEAEGEPETLKSSLADVAGRYDYAVIDCHPSMQLPTIASMIAADELLIPFEPDGYGRNGLILLQDYIDQIRDSYNPDLSYHVFITKFSGRASQGRLVNDLMEKYDFPVLNTVIRSRESVNTSVVARKPLLKHRSFSAATKDYMDLTAEVMALFEE